MSEERAVDAPTVLDGVAWIEIDGDVVALDPDAFEVHLITGTGALIWLELDGTRSVDDIVDAFVERFAAPRETIELDVRNFLDHTHERNLVTTPGIRPDGSST